MTRTLSKPTTPMETLRSPAIPTGRWASALPPSPLSDSPFARPEPSPYRFSPPVWSMRARLLVSKPGSRAG